MASKTKQQWKSALIVRTAVSAFFISKNKKEKKHEIQEQKPSGSIQRRSPQDEPSGRCENGGALSSDRRCSVVERIEEAHQERQH